MPAGTRHSLRPLDLRATRFMEKLGRNAPRERAKLASFVGWVERSRNPSSTHKLRQRSPHSMGMRFAPPILRKRRITRPLADHPRNLTAPFPPPRDPNGLRIVQLYPLFSRIYRQNRLETLRTSDVGTIDRRRGRGGHQGRLDGKTSGYAEAGHRPVSGVRRRLFRRTDRAVRRRAGTADPDRRAARAGRCLGAHCARRNEHAVRRHQAGAAGRGPPPGEQ